MSDNEWGIVLVLSWPVLSGLMTRLDWRRNREWQGYTNL